MNNRRYVLLDGSFVFFPECSSKEEEASFTKEIQEQFLKFLNNDLCEELFSELMNLVRVKATTGNPPPPMVIHEVYKIIEDDKKERKRKKIERDEIERDERIKYIEGEKPTILEEMKYKEEETQTIQNTRLYSWVRKNDDDLKKRFIALLKESKLAKKYFQPVGNHHLDLNLKDDMFYGCYYDGAENDIQDGTPILTLPNYFELFCFKVAKIMNTYDDGMKEFFTETREVFKEIYVYHLKKCGDSKNFLNSPTSGGKTKRKSRRRNRKYKKYSAKRFH